MKKVSKQKNKIPYKQKWNDENGRSIAPTATEQEQGKKGFEDSRRLKVLEDIIKQTDLFPIFVKNRKPDKSTIYRCYLWISEISFKRKHENLACIDLMGNKLNLNVRPFGKGKNREDLLKLPEEDLKQFSNPENTDKGWRNLIITDDKIQLAIKALNTLNENYSDKYDLNIDRSKR